MSGKALRALQRGQRTITTDDGGRGRKQGWMVQAEVRYMPQDLTATPGNS